MRAVVIPRFGGPEVLEIQDVPLPEPGPGQVRVRVRAFGLNRADLIQRRGHYPPPPDVPQDIPGLEYAGVIDALGPDVSNLQVGDGAMGIVGGGSCAEFVITAADHVLSTPSQLSHLEAAAVPEVFMTAHDALERLCVRADEWVLVHAVGSGVGTAAVQLIAARGGRSVGTSRTADKLERAGSLGMNTGIDSNSEDWAKAVREATGKGAHACVDLVGGVLFPDTLKAMSSKGRIILVGLTAGLKAEVNLGLILQKRLRIEGTVLRVRSHQEKADLVRSVTDQVLPLFDSGELRPIVDRTFSFEEIRAAHEYMETNANFGKIVVAVS